MLLEWVYMAGKRVRPVHAGAAQRERERDWDREREESAAERSLGLDMSSPRHSKQICAWPAASSASTPKETAGLPEASTLLSGIMKYVQCTRL